MNPSNVRNVLSTLRVKKRKGLDGTSSNFILLLQRHIDNRTKSLVYGGTNVWPLSIHPSCGTDVSETVSISYAACTHGWRFGVIYYRRLYYGVGVCLLGRVLSRWSHVEFVPTETWGWMIIFGSGNQPITAPRRFGFPFNPVIVKVRQAESGSTAQKSWKKLTQ